ncbi:MAG: WD40 repeat domain-containing protein, partial [Deltaproteobacteria bacterium]|nr:WD40 repeat domain-containing protein [Deltaproteobacteria bacterium]
MPGQVAIADVYWEIVLALGWISPAGYIGPHIWAVSASPDGERLAVGSMNQEVLLFDLATGEPLPSPGREREWVMEVLWSPDARWFASTSFSGQVTLREDATGRVVYQSAGRDVAYTVAFHPTRPLAAWGAYDGLVRLVDLQTGRETNQIPAQEEGVLYVTFTPDGEGLVASGEDGTIRRFTLDGQRVAEYVGHSSGVTAVSFSTDARSMISGGDDATVRVWDTESGALKSTRTPHPGWINFSTFLPGRDTFLTVGTDDDVFVWDLGDLEGEPRRLEAHSDWLMCVRPLPGGDRFVSAG